MNSSNQRASLITQYIDKPEYYVYLITNKVNGKQYIGYTSKTCEERFEAHCTSSLLIGKAIREFGRENFTIQPLSHAPNSYTAKWMERRLIKIFNTFKSGYNQTPGGDGLGKSPPNKGHCSFPKEVEMKLRNQQFFLDCIARELSCSDIASDLSISAESVRRYGLVLGIVFPRNTSRKRSKISHTLRSKHA